MTRRDFVRGVAMLAVGAACGFAGRPRPRLGEDEKDFLAHVRSGLPSGVTVDVVDWRGRRHLLMRYLPSGYRKRRCGYVDMEDIVERPERFAKILPFLVEVDQEDVKAGRVSGWAVPA